MTGSLDPCNCSRVRKPRGREGGRKELHTLRVSVLQESPREGGRNYFAGVSGATCVMMMMMMMPAGFERCKVLVETK